MVNPLETTYPSLLKAIRRLDDVDTIFVLFNVLVRFASIKNGKVIVTALRREGLKVKLRKWKNDISSSFSDVVFTRFNIQYLYD